MIRGCNLRVLTVFLIVTFSYGVSASVKKSDCMHKRNTICQQMIKLSPKMDKEQAYKISNIFSRMSKKYKLDPKLLVSIAFQESSFKADAIRKVSGFIYDTESKKYTKTRVGSDFCMMQIHISNIQKMELDVDKLLKSPKYCIEAGAKILSRYKKKHAKVNEIWWTHYNAKTKMKQNIYFEKVSRHLKKLNPNFMERNLASN